MTSRTQRLGSLAFRDLVHTGKISRVEKRLEGQQAMASRSRCGQTRFAFIILTLGILACNLPRSREEAITLPTPIAEGRPIIQIDVPPTERTGSVGAEFLIQSTSTDSVGVARVELYVDGVSVRTDTTPDPEGQTEYAVLQGWTPVTTGRFTLAVVAYRADGTASDPATLRVTISQASAEDDEEPRNCVVRANTDMNVRQGPGTDYPIVRVLRIGVAAPVTGHNGDQTWWQIGGGGWVSAPYTTNSGDCSAVQVVAIPPLPSNTSETEEVTPPTNIRPTGTPTSDDPVLTVTPDLNDDSETPTPSQ